MGATGPGLWSIYLVQLQIYRIMFLKKKISANRKEIIYIYIQHSPAPAYIMRLCGFKDGVLVRLDADQCQDGKPAAAQKIAEDT